MGSFIMRARQQRSFMNPGESNERTCCHIIVGSLLCVYYILPRILRVCGWVGRLEGGVEDVHFRA